LTAPKRDLQHAIAQACTWEFGRTDGSAIAAAIVLRYNVLFMATLTQTKTRGESKMVILFSMMKVAASQLDSMIPTSLEARWHYLETILEVATSDIPYLVPTTQVDR